MGTPTSNHIDILTQRLAEAASTATLFNECEGREMKSNVGQDKATAKKGAVKN